MKTSLTLIPLLLCLSLCFKLTAHAETWNAINDPGLMDKSYEYRFSALPLSAELTLPPWSETYWATAKGSINYRWNTKSPDGYGYTPPTREAVSLMTLEQLKELSPAEKFDIYLARYDYPVHEDAKIYSSPHAAWWKGICDGWTIAAIQFAEPRPVVVTNPDGIKVPFGASDIKGLLSYYAQYHSEVEQVYVGGQCHRFGGGKSACEDINPGALQIILANQIGLKHQAFGIDRDPGYEIWNQAVYGYKTEVKSRSSTQTGTEVLVHTDLFYTDELEKSSWESVVGTEKFKWKALNMDYTLELDSSGRITGGKYVNGSEHPDLAWIADRPVQLNGEYERLKDLLQP